MKNIDLSIEEIVSMFESAINCRVVRCVELSGDVFKLIFENGDTIGEIQFSSNNEFKRFCDAQKEAKCA